MSSEERAQELIKELYDTVVDMDEEAAAEIVVLLGRSQPTKR